MFGEVWTYTVSSTNNEMVARPLGSQQPQINHISLLLYILGSVYTRVLTWEDLKHGGRAETERTPCDQTHQPAKSPYLLRGRVDMGSL